MDLFVGRQDIDFVFGKFDAAGHLESTRRRFCSVIDLRETIDQSELMLNGTTLVDCGLLCLFQLVLGDIAFQGDLARC